MGFWDELTREELVIMHNAVEEAWLTGVIGDFLGHAEACGDRPVGKCDATSDRPAGVLRVNAVHQDMPFTEAMNTAVHQEIESFAALPS